MLMPLSFNFSPFFILSHVARVLPQLILPCPTHPSAFLFLFLFVTADLSERRCVTPYVFHFLFSLLASCLFSVVVGGGDGGRGCYATTGHSVLPFPSSVGSVRQGRMLYGVEILRERNDG